MNESDMTMEEDYPKKEDKPLAMMDNSQISLIATDCRKAKDMLRLSKQWGEKVIESEEPGYMCKEPKIEGKGTIYPMEYIMDFLKLFKKESTYIRILEERNRPLKLEIMVIDYDAQEASVRFYLAPRFEEETEVKEDANKNGVSVQSEWVVDTTASKPGDKPAESGDTSTVQDTKP